MFCFFTVFSFCGHVYIPDDERRDDRRHGLAPETKWRLVSSLRKKAPNVKPNKGARRVDSHVARVTMIDFAVRSRARIFPWTPPHSGINRPAGPYTQTPKSSRETETSRRTMSRIKQLKATSRRRARVEPGNYPAARASQPLQNVFLIDNLSAARASARDSSVRADSARREKSKETDRVSRLETLDGRRVRRRTPSPSSRERFAGAAACPVARAEKSRNHTHTGVSRSPLRPITTRDDSHDHLITYTNQNT